MSYGGPVGDNQYGGAYDDSPTSPGRTFTVDAETRTSAVGLEPRTVTPDAETRTLEVK